MKLSIFGIILKMFKSIFLILVISTLSSSIAWAGAISELSKQTDVSRLEFTMFKLTQELKEEYAGYYSLVKFNRKLYEREIESDYRFAVVARENELKVVLVISEDLFCDDAKPVFDNNIIKNIVGQRMDKLAGFLMSFFANFGDLEKENISGHNLVYYRVAKLFGLGSFGRVGKEEEAIGREIAEEINVIIIGHYCKKGADIPSILHHTYPLNAGYTYEGSLPVFPSKIVVESEY